MNQNIRATDVNSSEFTNSLSPEQELDEAELDARLASLRGAANPQQLAGGVTPAVAIALLILSLIGVAASLALIMTEKQHLLNPDAALICDVNPLIGCGEWIGAWQNEVFFGISNSVLGFGAFAALLMVSLNLICGSKLPRLIWQLLAVGSGAGLGWLLWFMYQSFFVKAVLCPYCMVVWAVTIPIGYILISRAFQAQHFGDGGAMRFGQFLVRNQGAILVGIYLVIIVTGTFALWDSLIRLF